MKGHLQSQDGVSEWLSHPKFLVPPEDRASRLFCGFLSPACMHGMQWVEYPEVRMHQEVLYATRQAPTSSTSSVPLLLEKPRYALRGRAPLLAHHHFLANPFRQLTSDPVRRKSSIHKQYRGVIVGMSYRSPN